MIKKMRDVLAHIIYIPAVLLLLLTEVVGGQKITWRAKDTINRYLKKNPDQTCTKCGHTGTLFIIESKKKK